MNRKGRIILVSATAAVLVLAGSGCSRFNRDWKAAVQQPPPNDGLAGAWEGRWVSSKNGHKGRLRCLMVRQSDELYQARFHAVFWKILRASYEVPFKVQDSGGRYTFTGEADLGKLSGGLYTYEGSATGTEFNATYRNKYDHGIFEMSRPAAAK